MHCPLLATSNWRGFKRKREFINVKDDGRELLPGQCYYCEDQYLGAPYRAKRCDPVAKRCVCFVLFACF